MPQNCTLKDLANSIKDFHFTLKIIGRHEDVLIRSLGESDIHSHLKYLTDTGRQKAAYISHIMLVVATGGSICSTERTWETDTIIILHSASQ